MTVGDLGAPGSTRLCSILANSISILPHVHNPIRRSTTHSEDLRPGSTQRSPSHPSWARAPPHPAHLESPTNIQLCRPHPSHELQAILHVIRVLRSAQPRGPRICMRARAAGNLRMCHRYSGACCRTQARLGEGEPSACANCNRFWI